MSDKLPITVILLTLNEAHNLEAALDNILPWAQQVFVVDSLSSDRTVDIALEHGAQVVQRRFTSFGDQWNWALDHLPVETPWTLKLDPDERVTPELREEFARVVADKDVKTGYAFRRRLWFMGKPLRQTQSVVRLWRTGHCRFTDVTVNEHPVIDGPVGELQGRLEHYDSPSLHHWFEKQNTYSTMRAIEIVKGTSYAMPPRLLRGRLQRRMFYKMLFFHTPFRHWLMWFYLAFVRGAIFDGKAGRAWVTMRVNIYRWAEYKAWEILNTGREPNVRREESYFDPRVLGSDLQQSLTYEKGSMDAEGTLGDNDDLSHGISTLTTKPLHIVHFLGQLRVERGGVVRALLDMVVVLAARGHKITLITSDAKDVPAAWRRDDTTSPHVVVVPAPLFSGTRLSRKTMKVVNQVLKQNVDLLHLHEAWGLANVQMAQHARRLGVPYMVSPHGSLAIWAMDQKWLKKRIFLQLLGRRYLRNAAALLFTAKRDVEEASRWVRGGRLVQLPLIFDMQQFKNLPGPQPAERRFRIPSDGLPRILYLSRIHPKKGVDLLIDAMRILRDRKVACRLYIAGPEDVPAYVAIVKAMVEKYHLQDHISFLGMVRGDLKLSLYDAADLFILPTHMENFGLVQVEAMACRTPVITTKGVAIWQELQGAGAEIIDRSAESIADAVEKLLADRQALKARGEHARQWVCEYLEPEHLVDEYETLFASICDRRDGIAIRNAKDLAVRVSTS